MRRLILVIISIAFLASCESLDKRRLTDFYPTKVEHGYQYFTYKAPGGDFGYPVESQKAEKTRLDWLKQWLADNNYSNTDIEILSRKVVSAGKAPLGEGFWIYYEGRVKEQKPSQ